MNKINKDFLKEVFANAIGTLLAGAVLTILAFFIGKIDFFIKYWKELSFTLFLVFIVVTLVIWFKKIIQLEQKIENFINNTKIPSLLDYSKDIALLKSDLVKKADKSNVPDITNFKDLQRTVKEIKIFVYAQKGQKGEILETIELLKEDIDNNSWQIDGDLENLEKTIQKINLETDLITDIEEQLCRLDDKPKYKFLINKIRKHYQS
jgi:hypothetical protein